MPENLSTEAGSAAQPGTGKMPAWGWILIGCGGLTVLAGLFFIIVPIIAAIAIPSLIAARHSSFETAGAANLRAYATAQTMYIKTDWDGNGTKEYAVPFTNLYLDATVAPPRTHKLIDKGFADATVPTALKQGFYFGDLVSIAGVPLVPATGYGLCAAPGSYNRTGTKIYVIQLDGRPTGTDAVNVQAGLLSGQVANLINDYPSAALMAAQKWAEAD
jgi:hypothetical protein